MAGSISFITWLRFVIKPHCVHLGVNPPNREGGEKKRKKKMSSQALFLFFFLLFFVSDARNSHVNTWSIAWLPTEQLDIVFFIFPRKTDLYLTVSTLYYSYLFLPSLLCQCWVVSKKYFFSLPHRSTNLVVPCLSLWVPCFYVYSENFVSGEEILTWGQIQYLLR